ncbi:hypothetical protein IGI04_039724, partial [Brassica rapa subsp. trilocularis]
MSRLHFAFIVLIRCWSVPWSDLRCLGAFQSDQSRATTSSHSQPERPARATSSSHSRFDASRHKKTRRERPPGATMLGRSACFAWTIFMLFQGPFGHFSILDHPRSNPYAHEFSFPLVKKPQQNPSSGSSAPQESSTDTLLKQILESQTRSEKHVGYELKNLHTKIDGSYNELNNKFSHLASTVRNLENQSLPARATSPERLPHVTPSQSDQPERLPQVTRVLTRRDAKKTRRERLPGATMLGRSACFAWTIFIHWRQDNLFSREEL